MFFLTIFFVLISFFLLSHNVHSSFILFQQPMLCNILYYIILFNLILQTILCCEYSFRLCNKYWGSLRWTTKPTIIQHYCCLTPVLIWNALRVIKEFSLCTSWPTISDGVVHHGWPLLVKDPAALKMILQPVCIVCTFLYIAEYCYIYCSPT